MLNRKDGIFTNLSGAKSWHLKEARERGSYKDISALLKKGRAWMIEEVKKSGLRGRGGAGFATGVKWSFMPPKQKDMPHYVIVNADEGEPGTCKDRDIMRFEPHLLIEGTLMTAYALHAETAYIYIRGEFFEEGRIIEEAIGEAYQAQLLGKNAAGCGQNIDMFVHYGAGAYICGEETALLESLEGRKGQPRLKPPYPAQVGLYGCPTTVNNVETLAMIPDILRRGAKWFSSLGTSLSAGTKIFCISGHVNKPCNVEEELGVGLKELIETHAGGVRGGWNNLLAVIPGGSSVPLLPKKICDDIKMDFESLSDVQSHLGTAAVIVMDKSTDIIQALTQMMAFYKHESCGQCTPCREGTGWVLRMMQKITAGKATKEDILLLEGMTKQIEGHTICAFGEAVAWPVQGLLRHFGDVVGERLHA